MADARLGIAKEAPHGARERGSAVRGQTRLWRRPSLWIGIGATALVLLIGYLSGGVGSALVLGGVIALFTGLYALITGRPSWVGMPGRKPAGMVAIIACAAVITGTGVYGAAHPGLVAQTVSAIGSATPTATATPRGTVTASPTPTPTVPTATPEPMADAPEARGTALALLQTLPVKGRAPKTGYDRVADFGPAWEDADHNGCDTRNDVLRRDLTGITTRPGTHECVILTGTLTDPYTGHVIDFQRGEATSTAVQIDHVVALMNAWESGAQQISQDQREELANDPLNLLAVDGPTNEAKGAGDAATWLPPYKPFRCTYVARQITVKAKYDLWVTPAEHDAMAGILAGCPDQPVATAAGVAVEPAPVTVAPAPAPAPVKPAPAVPAPAPAKPAPAPVRPAPAKPAPAPAKPAPAAPSVVHPGAYCSSAGARGVTVKGTPMVCKTKPGDARLRWRAA